MINQEYREKWNNREKLIFQLIFVYFILYIFLMFFGGLFETPFKWIGKTVLGISYSYDISGFGSGDHTYAYILLFINAVFTLIITVVWHLTDKSRPSYNTLLYWFMVLLRTFLFIAMALYGFVKVFQIQFPAPTLIRLLEPLGNFSPMGLAWTYMGYSTGFNIFVGLGELLGGFLLLSRKTQTLGAFIIMGVMTHVAMMNFMFDIPVKLFSVHLVIMAAILFLMDIRRFINVFFKNSSTHTVKFYSPLKDGTLLKFVIWIKRIGITLVLILGIGFGFTQTFERGNKREKPLLYGIWEVETFIKNSDTLMPLITDKYRWRYLVVDYKDRATVKTMTDNKEYYIFIPDKENSTLTIYKDEEKQKDSVNFNYNINGKTLFLEGILHSDTLKLKLLSKDLNDFILKSRGFNWINERPFNQ